VSSLSQDLRGHGRHSVPWAEFQQHGTGRRLGAVRRPFLRRATLPGQLGRAVHHSGQAGIQLTRPPSRSALQGQRRAATAPALL